MSFFYFQETTNSIQDIISNLQVMKLIQNLREWSFKVTIHEVVDPKIKQQQQIIREKQGFTDDILNKNIVIYNDADDIFILFDANIKSRDCEQKMGETQQAQIISGNGLMSVLEMASLIEPSKRFVQGKGYVFDCTDFEVKIGEVKRSQRNLIIYQIVYKGRVNSNQYVQLYSHFMKNVFIDIDEYSLKAQTEACFKLLKANNPFIAQQQAATQLITKVLNNQRDLI